MDGGQSMSFGVPNIYYTTMLPNSVSMKQRTILYHNVKQMLQLQQVNMPTQHNLSKNNRLQRIIMIIMEKLSANWELILFKTLANIKRTDWDQIPDLFSWIIHLHFAGHTNKRPKVIQRNTFIVFNKL
jgi:hypothetical protein